MLIYSDITERKRSEAEIKAARDAAEAAYRDLKAAQATKISVGEPEIDPLLIFSQTRGFPAFSKASRGQLQDRLFATALTLRGYRGRDPQGGAIARDPWRAPQP